MIYNDLQWFMMISLIDHIVKSKIHMRPNSISPEPLKNSASIGHILNKKLDKQSLHMTTSKP